MFVPIKKSIRSHLHRCWIVGLLWLPMYSLYSVQDLIANDPQPPSPVSPTDSLRWFATQPGCLVELAASEPQVVDPVSMQIDEKGRLWVVEMRDYPTEDESPKSRVVILQDNDQDGFFETSTVFADKLRFATGVQPWQNGAIVTVHGQLLMLRDTDGDLHADAQEVWLDGFSVGNPQLRANHPTISADGWLYVASGLRGGKIKKSIPFAVDEKDQAEMLDLTGCDLRVHMLTGRVESIAGPTQFGLSFDRLGHRYGCSNRQPCFEILSERSDLGSSPLSGLSGAIQEVSPGEAASKVHPLVNAWTTSNLHAGQFTAACGLLVTHSRHFPDAPFATALTCEPTGGLVQRRSVARQQGRSKVSDMPSEHEWLASRDSWFRPVDLFEGPNGDIYVVDMYRAVIEHPEWVPAELKTRPDQRFGDTHGRIYRVSRSNAKHIDKDSPSKPDILAWLKHPDTWNRNIASRLFFEAMQNDRDESLIAKLNEMVVSNASNVSFVGPVANACLLLSGCDALNELTINTLLRSENRELRSLAWSCLHQSSRDMKGLWRDAILKTFQDPNSTLDELRCAAWYATGTTKNETLSASDEKSFFDSSAKMLVLHGDDAHLWMAVASACKGDLPMLVTDYQKAVSQSREAELSTLARDAIGRLASRIASQSSEPELKRWIESCTSTGTAPENATASKCNFAVLEGFVRSGKVRIAADTPLETLLLKAAEVTSDPINQRSAVAILAACSSESSKRTALKLLEGSDSKIVKVAIATCSSHDAPEFSSWLLERLPSALPDIRQDIFLAIRNKSHRLSALLDRLESGAVSTKLFDASQIQALKGIQDASLAPRIAKLLSASINLDRQKVIDEYLKQLASIQVNERENRGKAVFEKNCVACHRLDSIGTIVGPDISDSRVQTFEKLLVSILDPNRSIDANYFRYLARTKDGRVVEGILKDANAQTITLQNQNGAIILERSEIEELKSSGTSLMPEGIEAQIPASDMADLLWYIKNWRYAAENIPANATISK